MAELWWDPNGKMGQLHAINELRLQFITDRFRCDHPRVVDVGCPGQILGCVVAIDKTDDAQAKAAMRAAVGAHRWMKFVVVVDADVDTHDPDDVMWAIRSE